MKRIVDSCFVLMLAALFALPAFCFGQTHSFTDSVWRPSQQIEPYRLDSLVWPIKKWHTDGALDWLEGYPESQLIVLPVTPKPELNTNLIPLRVGLGFISGAARGLNQVLEYHPDRFFERYPNANRRFWDNDISWLNKYKNGDPAQGPAFPFSTNGLSWATDGHHLTGTMSNLTGAASLTIPLWKGGKKKFRHYLADVGFTAIGYWAGFHGIYTLWFP